MKNVTVVAAALCVALFVIAACVTADADTIANPQLLNMAEWYGNTPSGIGLLTQVTATSDPSIARYTLDGGFSSWANEPVGAKLRYSLPQAVTLDKFYLQFGTYGEHIAKDFTIRYSDTIDWNNAGWASAPSVVVTNNSSGTYTADIPDAPVKNVELTLDAIGPSGYMQVREFDLLAPSSATINADGRNICADPYTYTWNDIWANNGAAVWSNNLNPDNSIPYDWDAPTGPGNFNPYWQINFGAVRPVNLMTFSTYPGQNFSSVSVYASTDGVNFGSPIWTGANVVNFREAIFPAAQAQYLRVVPSPDGSAMNDIHVFYVAPPVPEPATMALLALGGLVLVVRSRENSAR